MVKTENNSALENEKQLAKTSILCYNLRVVDPGVIKTMFNGSTECGNLIQYSNILGGRV